MGISKEIQMNITYMNRELRVDLNYDICYHTLELAGRTACIYFVDGFLKDDTLQKILQYFASLKEEDFPKTAHEMVKKCVPYAEVDMKKTYREVCKEVLSGVPALFVDGYDAAILIDCRTYPARSVSEPEKDKALRGSKDGFVETIVFNTALLRRRIRTTDLCIEMMTAGKSSKTDIAVCYMDARVDRKLLKTVKGRINHLQVDALTMNQESLAEGIFKGKWYNPFPKFKYTERPDTAAAQVLEGNIIIFVDNSPSAMILPTSIFDIVEEADDYYFPPVTGTYLRLTRLLTTLVTYLLTPTFLLLMQRREWIPDSFRFIELQEVSNIPLLAQFLILEFAIDGLKLAAVNTPDMLSTPLSVMAGLVLGQFAVDSGWFNAEVLLYMAFVAIANYTQANYEMGYALKFLRIITLMLTAAFDVWGYILGIILAILAVAFNKTIAGESYLYPVIPFRFRKLLHRLLRKRQPMGNNKSE